METKKDDPMLLIDLSAIFRAAWHVIPSDGSPNVAYEATISGVNRCVDMTRKHLGLEPNERLLTAICCDGKGNWRKALSAEYKAHREVQPPSMYGLLDKCKAKLSESFLLWECSRFEADDIIGTAVCCSDQTSSRRVVVASHDKDLCQLSATFVDILNTSLWIFADRASIIDKWKVKPHMIPDVLALMGDKADNVAGCDGCGMVGAVDLIQRYETVEKLYAYIDNASNTATDKHWRTSDGKKPLSILDKLLKAKESVLLAKRLVRLDYNAPIVFEDIYKRIEPKKLADSDFGSFEEDLKEVEEIADRAFGKLLQETGRGFDTMKDPVSQNLPIPCPACEAIHDGPCGIAIDSEVIAKDVERAPETQIKVESAPRETALTVTSEFERQLEPTSVAGAMKAAQVLWESGLYTKFKNPAAIGAIIIRGREMGFGMCASLDMFHVIKDAPAPKAHVIIHLGETHPDCEYMILTHSDEIYAEYVMRRKSWPKGREVTHRYEIQDSVNAGLATIVAVPYDPTKSKDDRGQWDKRRKEMLRKTCGCQIVRIVLPGAGLGLTSYEELGGE